MKINKLFFAALALMAASCTNHNLIDDVTEAKPLTITVTLPDEAPATRITYDFDVLNGVYKGVWNDGDALSVVYKIGGQVYNDKFELATKSADGRTATFTAPATTQLPATGTATVGVFYPYRQSNESYSNHPTICMLNNYDVTSDNLAGMGNYCILYATNLTVTNRQIPLINLSNVATSFLRLPQGLQIFNNHTGTAEIWNEKLKANGFYLGWYAPEDFFITSYDTGVKVNPNNSAEIKDGILQRDVFIPIMIKENYTGTAELMLSVNGSHYSWTLPSRTISAGKVYTVKQDKMPAQAK